MPSLRRPTVAFALALTLIPTLAAPAAAADARFSGFYRVYLSGVTIGKAGLDIDIGSDSYAISGWGKLSGMTTMYSHAIGSAKSAGKIAGDRVIPRSYHLDMRDDAETSKIDIGFIDGNVSTVSLVPASTQRPDRVPVEEHHKKNVTDPMSALLVPHPAGESGQTLCSKTAAVFEGQQRFNLPLVYKKSVKVRTEDGSYKGIAHVCGARYRPLAGHVPARWAIRYMMENKNLEVWLTPVAGTGYAVPWRISIGTAIGPATVEAESFQIVNR